MAKVKTPAPRTLAKYAADPLAFLGDLIIPGIYGPVKFADVWADFQREAFEKLKPCILAVAAGSKPPLRGAWLERTKGASKDSDVGLLILWLLLFCTSPQLVELGANKQDQADETRKAIEDALRLNPWITQRVKILRHKITCSAAGPYIGGVVEVLTTESTGAHGSRPTFTVCNELSHILVKSFAETMLDNADKLTRNFTIIATNAGIINSWQWQWRENYRNDPDWYWQKVDCPAPWIDERNIAGAKRRNSISRFLRLWHGVWSTGDGDALDPEDIERASVLRGPHFGPFKQTTIPPWFFAAGVDLGVRHDHAALVVLGSQWGSGRVSLMRCRSWAPGLAGRVDTLAVRKAIIEAEVDFGGLVAVDYDPSQMEHMAQELEIEDGIFMNSVKFIPANLNIMARDLLAAFRDGLLDIYDDPRLVADLHRLSIVEKRYGYKLEAISDEQGHADRAIALAIVLPRMLVMSQMQPPINEGDATYQLKT